MQKKIFSDQTEQEKKTGDLTTAILRKPHERLGFKVVTENGRNFLGRTLKEPWRKDKRRTAKACPRGMTLCHPGGFHWSSRVWDAVQHNAECPIIMQVRAEGPTIFTEKKNMSRTLTPLSCTLFSDLLDEARAAWAITKPEGCIVSLDSAYKSALKTGPEYLLAEKIVQWFTREVIDRLNHNRDYFTIRSNGEFHAENHAHKIRVAADTLRVMREPLPKPAKRRIMGQAANETSN